MVLFFNSIHHLAMCLLIALPLVSPLCVFCVGVGFLFLFVVGQNANCWQMQMTNHFCKLHGNSLCLLFANFISVNLYMSEIIAADSIDIAVK